VEIVQLKPNTLAGLAKVDGIEQGKLEKYGASLLSVLKTETDKPSSTPTGDKNGPTPE